jgi:hypothetical protein
MKNIREMYRQQGDLINLITKIKVWDTKTDRKMIS